MEDLLKPGTKIKADISDSYVFKLAKKLYGLEVSTLKKLNGYDDINYWLQINGTTNTNIEEPCPHGYVLKIMNKIDSLKEPFVEAQNEIMLHLGKHRIKVPQPVRNMNGELYSIEKIVNDNGEPSFHAVRLLTYQVGTLLKYAPPSNQLFFNIGEYMADVILCLKHFSHPAYYSNKSIWMLQFTPALRQFIYVIDNPKKQSLVNKTIQDFEQMVLRQIDHLEKGIIHGDFNESNILVNNCEVASLLDFGDSQYGPYLFEIAVCLCYMLLQTQDLEVGKYVLAGFTKKRKLTQLEIKLLKVSICARFCQSLVLGAYSSKQDPDNEYILSTQKDGWTILEMLSNTDQQTLISLWNL